MSTVPANRTLLPTCSKTSVRGCPVSQLCPLLFHEPEIADALIKRLENFTYPKPLLDIVLVLETANEITHTALQRIQLPSWIKVVVCPDAKGLTTKARAMNYALDFCRENTKSWSGTPKTRQNPTRLKSGYTVQ